MLADKRPIIIGVVALVLLLGLGLFFILRDSSAHSDTVHDELTKRDTILELAKDYISQGKYQLAMDLLNELLNDDNEDEEAQKLKREVLSATQGNPQDVKSRETAEASRVQRESERAEVEALVQSGRQALEEKRYHDAIQDAHAALRILPDSIAAKSLKDDAQKALEETESTAERKARQQREEELRRVLGKAHQAIEEGRFKEARKLASQAREIDAQSGEVWAVEGEAWYLENPRSADNRRRARDAFESALQRNPEDWKSHYRLGQIAAADGKEDEAIDSFKRAVSLHPTEAEIWYEMGKTLYRNRRFDEAADAFAEVAKLHADYPNNWFNLGLSYMRLNKSEKAFQSFTQSIKVQPSHAASHYELGRNYLNSKHWSGAIDSFTMAANLAPENSQYWRSLGAAYFGRGSYDRAAEPYRKALDLEPTHGDTLYNLALIALKLGNTDEALAKSAAAVKSDGRNPIYLYTLGQAAEASGLNAQAASAYRKSASLDSDYSKPRINLGTIYLEEKKYDQALEYLLQALRIEPNSPTVWNNLGKAYLMKEDYANSLNFFEKAAASVPNDIELQMNFALALTETGDTIRAADAYRKVIALDSKRGAAYDHLIRLQFSSGNSSEARKVLNDLERAVPSYPSLAELKQLIQ